jgi:4-hydroxy-3-polyprenylbenzoate decarboxylase
MPFALVLGGYPAVLIAASAMLPESVDPYDFTGQLLRNPIEITRCRTNDLEVPAHAEFVIEGLIDPQADLHTATPVALPIGVSAARSSAGPGVAVTALTHRANPIFPAQIIGCSPGESDWIRWGLGRLFLLWLKTVIPELVDYHELISGVGRGWLIVSIRKSYPRQVHPVLHALWGHPQTMFGKAIVVVDESVNVHHPDEVWRAFASNVDPAVDIILTPGIGDVDDNLINSSWSAQKLGIDATVKLAEERCMLPGVSWLESAAETRQLVMDRWADYGLPGNLERNS